MNDLSRNPSDGIHLFEAFGVELEYMIVDRQNLHILPIADHVLKTDTGQVANELERGTLAWSNELVLHAIELKTNGPAQSLAGLDRWFHQDVQLINTLLQPMGAWLMPSAVHPFMDPHTETRLWPYDDAIIYRTFDQIFNCRGHGWANLQSVHLNLPFCGDDEFVRLHSAIRLLMPLIPALAAASPYLEGKDTGLSDSRLEMYWKNCASIFSVTAHLVPEAVPSIAVYHRDILEQIYRDMAPHDRDGVLRHEWTNARGAIARFDRQTIEIRVIDVQECPLADVTVLMVISQLVKRLVSDREALRRGDRLPADRLAIVLRDTIRCGERAMIRDADYLTCLGLPGKTLRAEEALSGLIEDVSDLTGSYRQTLDIILREGTLATRMRRMTGECTREHLLDTCRALCQCLQEGRLLIP